MKLRLCLLSLLLSAFGRAQESSVWIAGSGGLYHAEFDSTSGSIRLPTLAVAYGSGSWLEYHPRLPIIYSSWRETEGAGLIALQIGETGAATIIDRLALPQSAPAHFGLSPDGTMLAAAHYGGQTTTLVTLNPDGSFGEVAQEFQHEGSGPHSVQTQARPHWAGFNDAGTVLHVTDLGSDKIWSFDVTGGPNAALSLRAKTQLPPGSGPRHLAFSHDRRFAYVSDELSHHVSVFSYEDATAVFTPIQHIDAAPADLDEMTNNVSEILVHPSGRFVYTGNRGHDSIAVFAVDATTGRLTAVEREPSRGVWPRNFNFSPDGQWMLVAGQVSGTVAVFAIDSATGALRYNRQIINVPNPVRVLLPSP